MVRVLLVEDDPAIAEGLTASLESEGFAVSWIDRGDQALTAWEQERPDVIVLDLMLPGTSGIELCRRIRVRSDVPIIMVTARDGEVDRVVGLELGADDYVTKPFSTRELIARIRAVLRRFQLPATPATAVVAAGVCVDRPRHEVHVGEQPVELTPKEFDLLEYLVENAGLVLTRRQLIEEIWGSDYVGDTKTLDVHIKRLRAKVEPDAGQPRYITTVRGVGYRFEAAVTTGGGR